MAVRLILNADDFGLTRGINRAVAELHGAGAVTSATLMANGAAFDDAVAVAKAQPTLGVGCHVVLVDGVPLCRPSEIPTLIGADGKSFRRSLSGFLRAVLMNEVNGAEVTREAVAQIKRLQQAGLSLTHLDSHKHTHMLPAVGGALLAAAELTGIRAIRNPFEPAWSRNAGHAGLQRRLQLRLLSTLRPRFAALTQISCGKIATTEGTLGIAATGTLDAATLRGFLAASTEGTWEVVCHPGYPDAELYKVATRLRTTRNVEREALLEVLSANSPHRTAIELIHYGDVSTRCMGPSRSEDRLT